MFRGLLHDAIRLGAGPLKKLHSVCPSVTLPYLLYFKKSISKKSARRLPVTRETRGSVLWLNCMVKVTRSINVYMYARVRHHKSSGYASRFALSVHTIHAPLPLYTLPLSSSPSPRSLLLGIIDVTRTKLWRAGRGHKAR